MFPKVYKNLLESENKYDRLDAWFKVDYLTKILGIDEVRNKINFFLDLLCDEDLDIVLHAWQLLPKLIKLGLVHKESLNYNCFARALREGDINAWWIGIDLYKEGVINKDLLNEEINSYKKSLSADPLTRIGSWSLLPEMLRLNLVSEKEISESKLTELLKDKKLNYHVKLNVFYLIIDLIKREIIKDVDWRAMREIIEDPSFKQLSQAYEKNWEEAIQLIEKYKE